MGSRELRSTIPSNRVLISFVFLMAGLAWIASAPAQSPDLPSLTPDATGPNTSTAADFYVATNGNDSWPGTLAQPFRTVDKARLAVQALKAHVSGRTIRVLIRAGTYYLPSTWTFSGQDSGTSATPILYANYPGESPVISGGQPITGWVANSTTQWQTTLPSGTVFHPAVGERRTAIPAADHALRIPLHYGRVQHDRQHHHRQRTLLPDEGLPGRAADHRESERCGVDRF